jgi:hypothetical protein
MWPLIFSASMATVPTVPSLIDPEDDPECICEFGQRAFRGQHGLSFVYISFIAL